MDDQLEPLVDAVLAIAEDVELDGVLDRVVRGARRIVGARYAALGVLDADGEGLARFLHVGVDAETAAAIGPLPRGRGLLGELIDHPTPLVLDDLTTHPSSVGVPAHHPPMSSFLGVPVVVGDEVFGNLYLTDKPGGFDDDDRRLVVALAAVAGSAIRNARYVEAMEDLAVRLDRERIARDLHDTVIQRLFGAGLQLDGLSRRLGDDDRDALEVVIGELDAAIQELRATIAAVHDPRDLPLGDRLRAVVAALQPVTSALADLSVTGDPSAVPASIAADLPAVLREAVTNATRHARATRIVPALAVRDREVVLVVDDDGVGPPAATASPDAGRGLGLENLAARAARHGGDCELAAGPDGGAQLRWSAPLDAGTD